MCCLGLLLLGRGCQDLSPARSTVVLMGPALHSSPHFPGSGLGTLRSHCWVVRCAGALGQQRPHVTGHRRRCPGRKEDIRLIRIQASARSALSVLGSKARASLASILFYFLLYIYTLTPCLIASDSMSAPGAVWLFSSSQANRDFPTQLGFGVHLSTQQENLRQVGCQELAVSLGYTVEHCLSKEKGKKNKKPA